MVPMTFYLKKFWSTKYIEKKDLNSLMDLHKYTSGSEKLIKELKEFPIINFSNKYKAR